MSDERRTDRVERELQGYLADELARAEHDFPRLTPTRARRGAGAPLGAVAAAVVLVAVVVLARPFSTSAPSTADASADPVASPTAPTTPNVSGDPPASPSGRATPSPEPSVNPSSSVPSPPSEPAVQPSAAGRTWGPLAVRPPGVGMDTALAQGTLRITERCVVLEQGGGVDLLVWPEDQTIWNAETQMITFRNLDGTVVTVGDGDRVALGGGGDATAESGISGEDWVARREWVAPPALLCPLESRWGVGSVDGPFIAVSTQPAEVGLSTPGACPASLLEGTVRPHDEWGVALVDGDGVARDVLWPSGYAARRDGSTVVLVDGRFKTVAREGDLLRVGGGELDGEGSWLACGDIRLLARETIVLRPAPFGLGCDAIPAPYRRVTFRIDPAAADQVWAVADTGATLPTYWEAGFVGGTTSDPVVRDPEGKVILRDGDTLAIPVSAWPDLHGYFVCPSQSALYVLLRSPD